jgi:lysozyme
MIAQFEGFSANWYWDVNANAIGFGYNCRAHPCAGIKPPITREFAKNLLLKTLDPYERCVLNQFGTKITQDMLDGLVSFAYNLGCGIFKGSAVTSNIKAGNINAGAQAMCKYVNSKGRRLPGLVSRRAQEASLVAGTKIIC